MSVNSGGMAPPKGPRRGGQQIRAQSIIAESKEGGETAAPSPTCTSHRKADVLSEAWGALVHASDPPADVPTL